MLSTFNWTKISQYPFLSELLELENKKYDTIAELILKMCY
jgi:hypothetical protein